MIGWNEVDEIEIEGVDSRDYPDFCDAFITYAVWANTGKELTEDELIALQECNDQEFWEACYEHLM